MAQVFISYRRDDAPYAARLVRDALAARFGIRNVFFDVENIPPSQEWKARIEQELMGCKALVIIVGKKWNRLLKRASPESDMVQLEIRTSHHYGARIYVVLVDGVSASSVKPQGDLEFLCGIQFTFVRPGSDCSKDLTELVQSISGNISPRVELSFARIPAGDYRIGHRHGFEYEKPEVETSISRAFKIAKWPVTVRENDLIMSGNELSREFPRDNERDGAHYPAHNVNWFDAVEICNSLSRMHEIDEYYYVQDDSVCIPDRDSRGFRLPTEVEWEVACRLGHQDVDITNLTVLRRYARFGLDPDEDEPSPVSSTSEDRNGCFGMLGNVREWCRDTFNMEAYSVWSKVSEGKRVDPCDCNSTRSERVVRGGGLLRPSGTGVPVVTTRVARKGKKPGEWTTNRTVM